MTMLVLPMSIARSILTGSFPVGTWCRAGGGPRRCGRWSRAGARLACCHLVEVHQKVGLHQNLIVQTVHVGIGVVVGDEIAHPVDDGRIEAQPGQHLAGGGGALLLLGLAVVIAVFAFRVLDADVVGQCRGLQHELRALVQPLGLADEVGVGPDLGEVLNPARIGPPYRRS